MRSKSGRVKIKGYIKGKGDLEIIGVQVIQDGEESSFMADLVVDCSGTTSETPVFLKSFGVKLETTTVKTDLSYSSFILDFPNGNRPKNFIYYQPFPPNTPRGAIAIPIENGQYLVSSISLNRAPLPVLYEEMKEFTKDMPSIHEVLQNGVPTPEVLKYKKDGNVYHHYEKAHLDGLIVLGDAVCNFNPAYGQGQSTAAEGALLLDTLLRRGFENRATLCKEFQLRLCYQLTPPWMLVVLTDLRFPKTTGGSVLLRSILPFTNRVLDKLVSGCAVDPYLEHLFLSVTNMKQGYLWRMMSPIVLYKILTLKNDKTGW